MTAGIITEDETRLTGCVEVHSICTMFLAFSTSDFHNVGVCETHSQSVIVFSYFFSTGKWPACHLSDCAVLTLAQAQIPSPPI